MIIPVTDGKLQGSQRRPWPCTVEMKPLLECEIKNHPHRACHYFQTKFWCLSFMCISHSRTMQLRWWQMFRWEDLYQTYGWQNTSQVPHRSTGWGTWLFGRCQNCETRVKKNVSHILHIETNLCSLFVSLLCHPHRQRCVQSSLPLYLRLLAGGPSGRVRKSKNFPDSKIFTKKTFRIKCA